MKFTQNNHIASAHHLVIFWRSEIKGQGHASIQVCGDTRILRQGWVV